MVRCFFFVLITFLLLNKTNCFILHNTIKPLHVQYQCPITDYMYGKLHVSQISCIKKIWVFYWKKVNITDKQLSISTFKTTSTTKGKRALTQCTFWLHCTHYAMADFVASAFGTKSDFILRTCDCLFRLLQQFSSTTQVRCKRVLKRHLCPLYY